MRARVPFIGPARNALRGAALASALLLASPSLAGQQAEPAPAPPSAPRADKPEKPAKLVEGAAAQAAPKAKEASWDDLAKRLDKDGNGRITPAEHGGDKAQFLALDVDGDGVISAADYALAAKRQIAAARAVIMLHLRGLPDSPPTLNRPTFEHRLATLDVDKNGQISRAEFAPTVAALAGRAAPPFVAELIGQRDPFGVLVKSADSNGDGLIGNAELLSFFDANDEGKDGRWSANEIRASLEAGPAKPGAAPGAGRGPAPGAAPASEPGAAPRGEAPRGEAPRGAPPATPAPHAEGEGSAPAPAPAPRSAALGQPAPDFTLPRADGQGTVRLGSFAADKPVALIFGSHT